MRIVKALPLSHVLHVAWKHLHCIMNNIWLMAKKQLNMMEKMMDPNFIDYYIIDYAIPLIIDKRKSLPNRLWQPWVWLPLPLDKIFIKFATVFRYISLVTNQAILATNRTCSYWYFLIYSHLENQHSHTTLHNWNPCLLKAEVRKDLELGDTQSYRLVETFRVQLYQSHQKRPSSLFFTS